MEQRVIRLSNFSLLELTQQPGLPLPALRGAKSRLGSQPQMLLSGSQSGFSVNVVYSRIQRARKCNFLEIKQKNYRKGGWAEKHEVTQRFHRHTRRGDSKNKEAEVCRTPSEGKGTHFSTGRKLAVIYYCWQMELQPQLAIYQAFKKSSKLSWR